MGEEAKELEPGLLGSSTFGHDTKVASGDRRSWLIEEQEALAKRVRQLGEQIPSNVDDNRHSVGDSVVAPSQEHDLSARRLVESWASAYAPDGDKFKNKTMSGGGFQHDATLEDGSRHGSKDDRPFVLRPRNGASTGDVLTTSADDEDIEVIVPRATALRLPLRVNMSLDCHSNRDLSDLLTSVGLRHGDQLISVNGEQVVVDVSRQLEQLTLESDRVFLKVHRLSVSNSKTGPLSSSIQGDSSNGFYHSLVHSHPLSESGISSTNGSRGVAPRLLEDRLAGGGKSHSGSEELTANLYQHLESRMREPSWSNQGGRPAFLNTAAEQQHGRTPSASGDSLPMSREQWHKAPSHPPQRDTDNELQPQHAHSLSIASRLDILVEAQDTFDTYGGHLQVSSCGVAMTIPPGAIPMRRKQHVFFQVIRPHPDLHLSFNNEKGECLLGPIVLCGPSNVQFSHDVEICVPHCLALDSRRWEMVVMTTDELHSNGQLSWWDVARFDASRALSAGKCHLEPGCVRLSVRRFGMYVLRGSPRLLQVMAFAPPELSPLWMVTVVIVGQTDEAVKELLVTKQQKALQLMAGPLEMLLHRRGNRDFMISLNMMSINDWSVVGQETKRVSYKDCSGTLDTHTSVQFALRCNQEAPASGFVPKTGVNANITIQQLGMNSQSTQLHLFMPSPSSKPALNNTEDADDGDQMRLIDCLPPDTCKKVCEMLDAPHHRGQDWHALARHLGFVQSINSLEQTASPTLELLHNWRCLRGTSPENVFRHILLSMGRLDIARLFAGGQVPASGATEQKSKIERHASMPAAMDLTRPVTLTASSTISRSPRKTAPLLSNALNPNMDRPGKRTLSMTAQPLHGEARPGRHENLTLPRSGTSTRSASLTGLNESELLRASPRSTMPASHSPMKPSSGLLLNNEAELQPTISPTKLPFDGPHIQPSHHMEHFKRSNHTSGHHSPTTQDTPRQTQAEHIQQLANQSVTNQAAMSNYGGREDEAAHSAVKNAWLQKAMMATQAAAAGLSSRNETMPQEMTAPDMKTPPQPVTEQEAMMISQEVSALDAMAMPQQTTAPDVMTFHVPRSSQKEGTRDYSYVEHPPTLIQQPSLKSQDQYSYIQHLLQGHQVSQQQRHGDDMFAGGHQPARHQPAAGQSAEKYRSVVPRHMSTQFSKPVQKWDNARRTTYPDQATHLTARSQLHHSGQQSREGYPNQSADGHPYGNNMLVGHPTVVGSTLPMDEDEPISAV